jgi:hypothetical protein
MRRDAELIRFVGFARGVMRQPLNHVRLFEHGVEIVRRQIQGRGVNAHHAAAERFHRGHVGQHRIAKAGQLGRPLVQPTEPLAGDHVGIVGRTLAAQEECFVQAGFAVVIHRGAAGDAAAHRHVADVMFVDPQLQLLLRRLRMEAARLCEGRVDQRLRNAVAAQVVKADAGEGIAQRASQPRQFAGVAGEIRTDVEHGNDAAHHFRRGERSDGTVWHCPSPLGPKVV